MWIETWICGQTFMKDGYTASVCHPSICPFIRPEPSMRRTPSVSRSVHPTVPSSIHPSSVQDCPSVHASISPPSIHLSVCSPIHNPFVLPSIRLSSRSPVHPFVHLSVRWEACYGSEPHPAVHLSVCPSVHSSVCHRSVWSEASGASPAIRPSASLSVCPSAHAPLLLGSSGLVVPHYSS